MDLFRAADSCPAHAEEFLRLAPRPLCFWMQSGIISAETRRILSGQLTTIDPPVAVGQPVLVVEDRCLMVDHRNLVATGSVHV